MTTPQVPGGFPYGRDVVDVWLGKATMHLIAACGVTSATVGELFDGSLRFGQARWAELDIPREPNRDDLDSRPSAFLARLDESLGSILCSALAVEAAANSFVYSSPYDVALESLPPLAKLSVAPPLVARSDPFPPGSRVHARLAHLFELSEELVRPWKQAPGAPTEAAMFRRLNPLEAHGALEVAATAIATLDRLQGAPSRRITDIAVEAAGLLRQRAEIAAAAPLPSQEELDEEHRRAAAAFPAELVGA